MIQRYQDGIAIDVEHIRRRDASGALVDAEAAYITEAGVKRQVWPERLYLIQDGVLNSTLGSLNSSIYFNITNENTTPQPNNNASFSQAIGYATFSCQGIKDMEARGFLVSSGSVARRRKLVVECVGDYTIGAYISVGVISDSNYENLIKNTKKYYVNNNVEFSYNWKFIEFGKGAVEITSTLNAYELDISEIASESIHLCVRARSSGYSDYRCNIRVKNMYLI